MFTTKALRHIASIAAIALAVFTLAGAAILFAAPGDVEAQGSCPYDTAALNTQWNCGSTATAVPEGSPTPNTNDAIAYKPFTTAATATPVPNTNPVVAATPVPVATAAPAADTVSPVPQFTG